MMGEAYTIADVAIFPWVNIVNTFYGAGELVGMKDFREVNRVLEVFLARPAVIRGLNIPARS
jgi:GST-like protein